MVVLPSRAQRFAVALFLASAAACAGNASETPAQISATAAVSQQAMLANLAAHHVDAKTPLAAALRVGAAPGPNGLAEMEAALDGALTDIVRRLPRGDARRRGRATLEALFRQPRQATGRPLLQAYEADATTLSEIMTTGRFNCVSATILYLLAAERAGLEARPVLLPSHARAVVLVGSQHLVVETTSQNGFDAPPAVSRAALDRARPQRTDVIDLYADERGTEVDWSALLGIVYGNLGIMAEAHGDKASAAALLTREAELTPPAQVGVVKRQQMSLLTELATNALHEGKLDDAIELSKRADAAAPDPDSKRLADQNVTAFASQELIQQGPSLSDSALEAFAEPFKAYPASYGDIRALVLTKIAERRLKKGDVEGSASALREAATLATSDDVRGQTTHNARLGELNRLTKLSMTQPEEAWLAWQKLGPPDAATANAEAPGVLVMGENRAIHFSNEGHCPELEKVLAELPGLSQTRGNPLRGACHARHGVRLSASGDFAGAVVELRAAVRFDPSVTTHRQNLLVMIERDVDHLVHASHCDQALPLIAEGRGLDAGAPFWSQATAYCQTH